MDIKEKFGLAVQKRRKELGLTQEGLAMRIHTDEADKSKYADQSYVSKIELGQSNITLETIEQIAVALECRAGDLFSEI